MLVFPPAKINLGLQVLRMRPDGYRDIETVMMAIPLHDVLEAVVDQAVPNGELEFVRTGLDVPGDPKDDLCVKAHAIIRELHHLPGLRVHLHKAIPIGAGLGGGSSDGTHMLRLLNDLLGLGMSTSELLLIATRLGSDCAFFLEDRIQLATGRGEVLSPLQVDLRGWWVLLINPGVHVPTAVVYDNTPIGPARADLSALVSNSDPTTWNGRVMNVMEAYVLAKYPTVAAALERIRDAGAVYCAMSGSGSSVFGLFKEQPVLPALPPGHRGWVFRT